MGGPHYLYLMLSRTESGMGAMIRMLFRFPYNHCSFTLDPTFRRWVSFARYHRGVPFYGGFVSEPVERYLFSGTDPLVRIFRIQISPERRAALERIFQNAGDQRCGLIYNLLDAGATFFRFKIRVANAYTCLGFARVVLGGSWATIEHLNDELMPHLIYEGNLRALAQDSGDRADPYFIDVGPLLGVLYTMRQAARLVSRMVGYDRPDLVERELIEYENVEA